MNGSLNRRALVAALALAPGLLPNLSFPARAQDTSPFAGLGLPELDLTVTATTIEGVPASTPAGRYLVSVSVSEETGDEGGGLLFIKPSGDSPEAFLPLVTLDAPMLEEDEYDAHYYSATYPGGIYANAGETTGIVVDLVPGNWIVAGGFYNPQDPVQFEVTGEMPGDLPEPVTDVTISMADYSIVVSGGQLVPGRQVIKVDHRGVEPHHLYAGRSTVPVTAADMEAVLQADIIGTPATVDFNPDEDLVNNFAVAEMSSGSTLWLVADLEPGPHVFACFVLALADELPHAMHGMYLIADVEPMT